MLLTQVSRAVRSGERDRGSALAAVIGVIAVTVIIAASLLASTIFAVRYTGAGRAGVQASAAAEAGLDYARSRFTTCTGAGTSGTIAAPSGTEPTFTLQVAYRKTAGSGWTSGCPKADSTEVRITSSGYATGTDALATRKKSVMEGTYSIVVAEPPRTPFPNTIMAGNHIDIAAAASVTGTMSTPGEFRCNGTLSQSAAVDATGQVLQPGDRHVGGAIVNNGSCVTTGTTYTGKAGKDKYDPTLTRNEFPKIVARDPRLAVLAPTPVPLRDAIWQLDPYSADHPCDISGYQSGPHPLPSIVIDARECSGPIAGKPGHVPGPLRIRVNVTVELSGDMVWLVDDFDLSGYITVRSKPGTGTHSLYVIKPWDPARSDACATGAPKGIRMTGGGFITDSETKVMLYSSEKVDVTTSISMSGQIYGCDVRLAASTQLSYGQFDMKNPPVLAGWRLISKRDVTG